jgi:hypothetical protein
MKNVSARWSDCLVVMCDHRRAPGAPKPSCGNHDAEGLRAWLKEQFVLEGLWGRVRVVTASCLDVCPASGVALSIQGVRGDKTVRVVDPHEDRQALLEEMTALFKENV